MSDYTTTWSKQELSAYVLLYCANANLSETEERNQPDSIKGRSRTLQDHPQAV